MARRASKKLLGGDLKALESSTPTAAQRIREIRCKGGGFKTQREVLDEVQADLFLKGEFLSDGMNAFFKPKDSPYPILLEKDDRACQQLLSGYFITHGEKLFDLVVNELALFAHAYGRKVALKRLCTFDATRRTLYISNRGRSIIRITSTVIEEVSNGTDGVLFYEPNLMGLDPISIVLDPTTEDDFRESMIDSISFMGSDEEQAHQRRIYELYLHSLFFPELMHTRPILMLVGEPGSGKTYTLSRVGRLLCGETFHVTQMPGLAKDFDAVVTNQSFVALDDVESSPAWLNDKLAVCATGGEIATRELFTTNRLARFPISARIAMSAHSPRCRRGDVSDRLLVLTMPRWPTFRASVDMDRVFIENRPRIYSGLLYSLQGVLAALEESEDYRYEGGFRMADFASFAMRIAAARDEVGPIEESLDWIVSRQRSFTHEENPLVDFLAFWVEETKGTEEALSTGRLFEELTAFSRDRHLNFDKICATSISLGKKLAECRSWDDCPFSICYFLRGARMKVWTIRPKGTAPEPSQSLEHLHTDKRAAGAEK